MMEFDDVIRIGKITRAKFMPEEDNFTYRLKIDLGRGRGIKVSWVRYDNYHARREMEGKLVMCVDTNGEHSRSDVCVMRLRDCDCVLIEPSDEVVLGSRMY